MYRCKPVSPFHVPLAFQALRPTVNYGQQLTDPSLRERSGEWLLFRFPFDLHLVFHARMTRASTSDRGASGITVFKFPYPYIILICPYITPNPYITPKVMPYIIPISPTPHCEEAQQVLVISRLCKAEDLADVREASSLGLMASKSRSSGLRWG